MKTNIECTKVSWINLKRSTLFLVLLLLLGNPLNAADYQDNNYGYDSLIIGEMPCHDSDYSLKGAELEENFLLTFEHENKGTFSITLFDFQDEKVQVLIHDAQTGDKLYAINLEPSHRIFKSKLLARPLPTGTYYVVVSGESRIIPKEIKVQ